MEGGLSPKGQRSNRHTRKLTSGVVKRNWYEYGFPPTYRHGVLKIDADQFHLDRLLDQTGGIMDAQLLYYIRPVKLHGPHTDEQFLGDLLIRVPLGDELQDLSFPVG